MHSVVSKQNTVCVAGRLVLFINIGVVSEAQLVSWHPVHWWLYIARVVAIVHRDGELLSVHILAFLKMSRKVHVSRIDSIIKVPENERVVCISVTLKALKQCSLCVLEFKLSNQLTHHGMTGYRLELAMLQVASNKVKNCRMLN